MKYVSKVNILLFTLLVLILLPPNLTGKFCPDIKWREIKTKNIIVVYPETYYEKAFETAIFAENIYKKLKDILLSDTKEKIRILISDSSDIFHYDSSIFPYCHININLAQPMPDRIYSSFKAPFNFFLTREIAKLFISKFKGGPINALRNIFGNHPVLSPVLFIPSPFIEGFSTFLSLYIKKLDEKLSNELNITLKAIAEKKDFPQFSKLSGNYSMWPTKMSKFIFGTGFVLFLYENYPFNTMLNFLKSYVKLPLKYSSYNRIKHYFIKNQDVLWNTFGRKYKKKIALKRNYKKINIIDNSGMIQRFPYFIGSKTFFLLKNNFIKPEYFMIKGKLNNNLYIDGRDIFGISYDYTHKRLYFSSIINTKPYSSYSDIFEYNINGNSIKQITFGKRLITPYKVPNKEKILCVKRFKNSSYLSFLDLKTKENIVFSNGFEGLAYPVLSPDKKTIACSVKTKNKYWRIALFDLRGNIIKYITTDNKISYYPIWKNNNELYYISEYNKSKILFKYNLENNKYSLLEIPEIDSIKYFAFSSDFSKIIFTYINYNGYNTAYINIEELKEKQIKIKLHKKRLSKEIQNKEKEHTIIKSQKYNYKRELLPKYFTPTFAYAGNKLLPGFMTSGMDVLKRHEYVFSIFYSLTNKKLSYDFSYEFRGLYQNIGFKTSDKQSLNKNIYNEDNILRTVSSQMYIKHPFFNTKNHRAFIMMDLHFEKILSNKQNIEENNQDSVSNNVYNGLSFSLIYNSSKRYYDSISNNDGFMLSLTYSRDLKIFGSKNNVNSLFFEYKHFIPMFRPNVLAFRLSLFSSWGQYKRNIFMGGAEAYSSINPIKNKFFGLMRGFPSGYFYGSSGYLLNMEYRLSLLKVEDTFLFLPYIEKVYLTFFTDIGKLLTKTDFRYPSISFGTEFNIKFNLAFPITLSCGIAKGRSPEHKAMFYVRLENSF